ncbi:hypothetical protein BCR37DRAFT_90681 [Protomyces lactucae-debilis]|uniref:Uncharacterized protein n=1 Tax=Protomyces lactucae-debilis TaxID=2754530 RepID=A0A1Y2F694_PROLT|nr:uncharacterized protein BCR37DRAFT_90681 [Protomyces lactucae-debilis]ORY79428.1 hypothetical protein BCR37DRAFT_90681 [Protomyces lactucae-debilis]
MLTSTGCLLCFIGSMFLQLSLLSFVDRGTLAQQGGGCMQYQVDAHLLVTVKLAPTCDAETDVSDSEMCSRDSYLQGSSAGTGGKIKRPRLSPPISPRSLFTSLAPTLGPADCEAVCAKRIADLVYSIAGSNADPCLYIMDKKKSAWWDILFRHPRSGLWRTPFEVGFACSCQIGMVVQRAVHRLPLQSERSSIFANPSSSSVPVFDSAHCEPSRIAARILNTANVLQQQSWYPKPSYTKDRQSPDFVLEDHLRGWVDYFTPDGLFSPISCNHDWTDLFKGHGLNIQSNLLKPPHSSNCSLKYYVADQRQSGYNVLCCHGELMAPIKQRIELLDSADPRVDPLGIDASREVCTQFGIPVEIEDMIFERAAVNVQLGWKPSQMNFM